MRGFKQEDRCRRLHLGAKILCRLFCSTKLSLPQPLEKSTRACLCWVAAAVVVAAGAVVVVVVAKEQQTKQVVAVVVVVVVART